MATLDNILFANMDDMDDIQKKNSINKRKYIDEQNKEHDLDEITSIDDQTLELFDKPKNRKIKLENKSKNLTRISKKQLKINETLIHKKISYIKYDSQVYSINCTTLESKEPDNILCNIYSKEYNTKFDGYTSILEYCEPIFGFNYIIDYMCNYNINCFTLIFQNKETTELLKFKDTLVRLKFNNFLAKINSFYPIIKIGNYERLITKRIINFCEPNNTLFNDKYKTYSEGYEYYHNRDAEIFNEWLLPYLKCEISVLIAAARIVNLLKLTCQIENKEYKYHKIVCDIEYYHLLNLRKTIIKHIEDNKSKEQKQCKLES